MRLWHCVLYPSSGASHIYIVKALKRPTIKKSTLLNPVFSRHGMPATFPLVPVMPIKFLFSHTRDQRYIKALRSKDGEEKEDRQSADCVLADQGRDKQWGTEARAEKCAREHVTGSPRHGHHQLWILGKCREEGQPTAGSLPGISGIPPGRS